MARVPAFAKRDEILTIRDRRGRFDVAIEMMCRKIGMTQLFNETGGCDSVTVLDAAPNVVVQKKNTNRDGYSAAHGNDPEHPFNVERKDL